jgi:hypothetical protein
VGNVVDPLYIGNNWSTDVKPFGMNRGLKSYKTVFPLTESPISEGGRWINGGTTGLQWNNFNSTTNFAYGTIPGNGTGPSQYADSTACLSGDWGTQIYQTASATASVPLASDSPNVYEELELRLMTIISADYNIGYEINTAVHLYEPNYIEVGKWNGTLGYLGGLLAEWDNVGATVTGDVLTATIEIVAGVGTITVTRNGILIGTCTDSTPYNTGSPGIGYFLQGTTGVNQNYGWSSFSCASY